MSLETLGQLAWLVPGLNLAAFVVIVALIAVGRGGRSAGRIAVLGIAASAVLGILMFLASFGGGEHVLSQHPFYVERFTWAAFGTDTVTFGWMIDPLTAVMVAMVTVVCTMIFIYATGYMAGEFDAYKDPETGEVDRSVGAARYARFFAYVALFATGMLGFVMSSNLLQAIVFWEIMGLCSFLLIGFWYYKPSAAAAAKKAFMTTRIGDAMLLMGAWALYMAFGTLDYKHILSAEAIEQLGGLGSAPLIGVPWATVVALLLFGGAVGKSAQFPLHVWLPDAMEGPTPVSALIHAATMVAAGVFLVARLYPVFTAGEPAPGELTSSMVVVAGIGAITALMAATIAVAQYDIKRVLAYSTISQLGYMFMALGIGAWVAAIFHLIAHAFFKALLFLGSGSVIHGVEHGMHHAEEHAEAQAHGDDGAAGRDTGGADPHDAQDMRNMGGLRTRMPLTFWTFLVGTIALTGLPVAAGFWSKDEILAEAWHLGVEGLLTGHGEPIVTATAGTVWLVGTIAAFFTAFYMARQVFMTFTGAPQTEGARHAPESAPSMVYPLVVLGVFALVLGFWAIPHQFPVLSGMLPSFHDYAGALPFGYEPFEALSFNPVPMAISVVIAVAGWVVGWLLYGRDPVAARAKEPLRRLGPVYTLLNRKYFFDEIYSATVVRFSIAFAKLNGLIDTYVVDKIVNLVGIGGEIFSRLNGWIDSHVVDAAVNLVGYLNIELARGLRLLQSGRLQQYLLVLAVSVLALVGAYFF